MHKDPQITRLIHENFWIVISYAFAQPIIANILNDQFSGDWKYLHKTMHEFSEVRADRSLLEMAVQIRVLDDHEHLNEWFREAESPPLGNVVQGNGSVTDLHLRDMTNKILHSASFEWNLADQNNPIVIFHPHDSSRWKCAELRIVALMATIGALAY